MLEFHRCKECHHHHEPVRLHRRTSLLHPPSQLAISRNSQPNGCVTSEHPATLSPLRSVHASPPSTGWPSQFSRCGVVFMRGGIALMKRSDVLGDMSLEITPKPDGGFVYKRENSSCNNANFKMKSG